MEQSAIVTGGNRNITLRGKGGANDNQYWPDGGIQIQGSYIKTKDGEILLEGAKGTIIGPMDPASFRYPVKLSSPEVLLPPPPPPHYHLCVVA